jgi:hypothetical protein
MGRLEHWLPLVAEWQTIMETYCRVVETDVPFWHRERTNLGLLASAAWRIDWVALEEFAHPKQFSTSREHGRSDLWIKGPRTEEFVEAKWHGVRIPSDRDRIGGTHAHLRRFVAC